MTILILAVAAVLLAVAGGAKGKAQTPKTRYSDPNHGARKWTKSGGKPFPGFERSNHW